MLLCGASFATRANALPVGFTNNYSGEYNCILSATSDCTSTTTRWTLGFNIDPSAIYDVPWRFEMLDGQTVTIYGSSEGSQLSYFTDGDWHYASMITSLDFTQHDGSVDYTSLLVGWSLSDTNLPGDPDSLTGIGRWRINNIDGYQDFYLSYSTGPSNYFNFPDSLVFPFLQSAGYIETPYTFPNGGISLMDSRYIYHSVPEPASFALLAIGIAAYGVNRRR